MHGPHHDKSRIGSVLEPSIGFEIKEGEEAQPEEYMLIFRGLRFKPDVEIGPEGRALIPILNQGSISPFCMAKRDMSALLRRLSFFKSRWR